MANPEGSGRASRWSLKGTTALVTGGTRGIGHAVVEELAEFGANVYTCSRKEEELNACLKEWKEKGFSVSGSVCDASSPAQRENLIKQVASAFNGTLNILVNNVGTNVRKPTIEYTTEEYSKLMATNLDSAYHLSQLAHPLLKASGNGSIVFISSVAGQRSVGSGAIYASTKAAMDQLTKYLACEWAKDNIRSNSVAPWYTKTPLAEAGRCRRRPPPSHVVGASVLTSNHMIMLLARRPQCCRECCHWSPDVLLRIGRSSQMSSFLAVCASSSSG